MRPFVAFQTSPRCVRRTCSPLAVVDHSSRPIASSASYALQGAAGSGGSIWNNGAAGALRKKGAQLQHLSDVLQLPLLLCSDGATSVVQ